MYRYIIGEDSYEDYHEYELLHEYNYTREEFLIICKDAYKGLKRVEKNDIKNHYNSWGTHYITRILKEKHGFIEPNTINAKLFLEEIVTKVNYGNN